MSGASVSRKGMPTASRENTRCRVRDRSDRILVGEGAWPQEGICSHVDGDFPILRVTNYAKANGRKEQLNAIMAVGARW